MSSEKSDHTSFGGFPAPTSNFCKVPHALFDAFPQFTSKSELMVVMYVLRHTWGFQDFDEGKHITIDEFMNGRKRKSGTRIDGGIGMSAPAVRRGIERAIEHGFLIVEIDDSDKARIEKRYALRMMGEQNVTPAISGATKDSSDGTKDSIGVTKHSIGENESLPRTEKETKERNQREKLGKEKDSGADAPKRDLLFEAVLKGAWNITYEKGVSMPAGRVNKICGELRKMEPAPTGDEVLAFYEWWKKKNPDLTPIRSHEKLPVEIMSYRAAIQEKKRKDAEAAAEADRLERESAARWEARRRAEAAAEAAKSDDEKLFDQVKEVMRPCTPKGWVHEHFERGGGQSMKVEDGKVIFTIPEEWRRSWLKNRGLKPIRAALKTVLGKEPEAVEFIAAGAAVKEAA